MRVIRKGFYMSDEQPKKKGFLRKMVKLAILHK